MASGSRASPGLVASRPDALAMVLCKKYFMTVVPGPTGSRNGVQQASFAKEFWGHCE